MSAVLVTSSQARCDVVEALGTFPTVVMVDPFEHRVGFTAELVDGAWVWFTWLDGGRRLGKLRAEVAYEDFVILRRLVADLDIGAA